MDVQLAAVFDHGIQSRATTRMQTHITAGASFKAFTGCKITEHTFTPAKCTFTGKLQLRQGERLNYENKVK